MRRFVGATDFNAVDNMNLISAIKKESTGFEDQVSDGDEFGAVMEESGIMDKEELMKLQSPFFDGLDDI